MSVLEKLEWALMTIRDQLTFGLPEEVAIQRREMRVKGVLIDAVKEVQSLQQQLDETNKELYQQRFNNQHNLSIDQKVADEMGRLRQRLDEAVKVIEELHALDGVPHLDDHFEFLAKIRSKQ